MKIGVLNALNIKTLLIIWRWRQQAPPNHWYLYTRLNDATSKKSIILILVLYLGRILLWTQLEPTASRKLLVMLLLFVQWS